MITDQKIHSFLLLADELNFSRAAEQLYISQQALSKQIASLEQAVGGALFQRSTAAVTLTPLGRDLQAFFTRSLRDYNDIRRRYLKLSEDELRICYFEDMDISQPLHEACRQLTQQYSGLRYRFSTRTQFRDILAALEHNEIDVAIIPDGVDFPAKTYRKLLLHKDSIFICFAPSLCASVDAPSLADLRNVTFYIGAEDNRARPVLDNACRKYGFQPDYYKGPPLTPSIERLLIEGGEGAGMGGKYSILNRDSLLEKIRLDFAASVIAVWRDHPDSILPERLARTLRSILNR